MYTYTRIYTIHMTRYIYARVCVCVYIYIHIHTHTDLFFGSHSFFRQNYALFRQILY